MLTKDTVLYKKAFTFAVRVVKLHRFLIGQRREYDLSKQILRSGTSIGANVAEANGAISAAEFSSKLSVAYKETLESKFWLALLKEIESIDDTVFVSLHSDADELSKILYSIIRSTRLKSRPK